MPKASQNTLALELVVCSTPERSAPLPGCLSLWVDGAGCLPAPPTDRPGTALPCCCPRRNDSGFGLALSCQDVTERMVLPFTTRSETSTFHAPSRAARRRCMEAHSSNGTAPRAARTRRQRQPPVSSPFHAMRPFEFANLPHTMCDED